jgi:hypothetical protein
VKTASILLALVVVLGFCREAGAEEEEVYFHKHKYFITVAGETFGFGDGIVRYGGVDEYYSVVRLGPMETIRVPFAATQGLVGFCCILATLIIVPAVLTVRWRKLGSATGDI